MTLTFVYWFASCAVSVEVDLVVWRGSTCRVLTVADNQRVNAQTVRFGAEDGAGGRDGHVARIELSRQRLGQVFVERLLVEERLVLEQIVHAAQAIYGELWF